MSENQEVQNEIDKTKAKIMYDELIIKYKYIKDMDSEENIIKKIIELKFNEESVKEYYDINKLFLELDEEYGMSAFINENEMKDKIKELHCDRELINEWIEEYIINGGN